MWRSKIKPNEIQIWYKWNIQAPPVWRSLSHFHQSITDKWNKIDSENDLKRLDLLISPEIRYKDKVGFCLYLDLDAKRGNVLNDIKRLVRRVANETDLPWWCMPTYNGFHFGVNIPHLISKREHDKYKNLVPKDETPDNVNVGKRLMLYTIRTLSKHFPTIDPVGVSRTPFRQPGAFVAYKGYLHYCFPITSYNELARFKSMNDVRRESQKKVKLILSDKDYRQRELRKLLSIFNWYEAYHPQNVLPRIYRHITGQDLPLPE